MKAQFAVIALLLAAIALSFEPRYREAEPVTPGLRSVVEVTCFEGEFMAAENTSIIQAAINSRPDEVRFNPGVCQIAGPVEVTEGPVTITGALLMGDPSPPVLALTGLSN